MSGVRTIQDFYARMVERISRQETRVTRSLRFLIDLTRHARRQLKNDRAGQLAAALSFRTIFSLVPLLVLSLLAFSFLHGGEERGQEVQQWVTRFLGLSSVRQTIPAAEMLADPGAPTLPVGVGLPPLQDTLPSHDPTSLELSISNIFDYLKDRVRNVHFRSIGFVGLVLLIWSAIALVTTVETSFNIIYKTPSGRAWHRRVSVYWAVITLGPVLLAISLYVTGLLVGWIDGVTESILASVRAGASKHVWLSYLGAGLGLFLGMLSRFTALAASWLLLYLLYTLLPNAQVKRTPAAAGSFIAAVLWELGKWAFKLYAVKAISISALYGSLGLIPLFLFWLYLNWLIVLFGLEITYALQTLRGHQLQEEEARLESRIHGDPRWLIPMMSAIAGGFIKGAPVAREDLARLLGVPLRYVAELCGKLEEAGLIHAVETHGRGEDIGYTLALPPERIAVTRLIDLEKSLSLAHRGRHGDPGWDYLEKLIKAQRDAAGDTTLAGILEAGHSPRRAARHADASASPAPAPPPPPPPEETAPDSPPRTAH